jgi:hypothetical protein
MIHEKLSHEIIGAAIVAHRGKWQANWLSGERVLSCRAQSRHLLILNAGLCRVITTSGSLSSRTAIAQFPISA